jgi:glutamate racemase
MEFDPKSDIPANAPLGVFDSGVGGLSVVREIRARLPAEDLLVIADSAWCPYGALPPERIRERAFQLTEQLLGAGAKAVVVACNTATIAAVEALRATFPVPFVGMEPAVKPAVAASRAGVIGVLATGAALAGEKFLRLVERHAGGVRVITRPCPGWVEQVEAGDLAGPATRALVERDVPPLVAAGADVLVLGCTHYPFLRELVEAVAGPAVPVIDTGAAVARQVERVLQREGLARAGAGRGSIDLRATGSLEALNRALPKLWPDFPLQARAAGGQTNR